MNVPVITLLTVFGLAMGVATLMGLIPRGFESPVGLVIGAFCGVWIARRVSARHFLHGFLVGFINGALSPLIQVAFFSLYLENNAHAAEAFQRLPGGLSPRLFVLICAPFVAIVSGLVVGLIAWVARKAVKPKAASG